MKSKKKDVPMLFVGVGGCGFDGVMRVKYEFERNFEKTIHPDGTQDKYPPRTEYCVIDTDVNVRRLSRYGMTLERDEFVDLSAAASKVIETLTGKEYVREWLDERMIELFRTQMAGGMRQTGRMMLFYQAEKVYACLREKLERLRCAQGVRPGPQREVRIKLIAGTSGACGSGMLLDIAYILRNLAEEMGCKIDIDAFLILPDVSTQKIFGRLEIIGAHYGNSYALLKELNYWMAAEWRGISMNQRYSDNLVVAWSGRPFDRVYFMGAQNDQGVPTADAQEYAMQAIAAYAVQECRRTENDVVVSVTGQARQGEGVFGSLCPNHCAMIHDLTDDQSTARYYHSLGMAGDDIENTLIELKEWTLICQILEEYAMAHPAVMKGNAPTEFCEAVLSMHKEENEQESIRARYNSRHRYPRGALYSARSYYRGNTKSTFKEMKDADEIPHGELYEWFARSLSDAHDEEAGLLLAEIRALFEKETRKVGEDIKRGPAYLRDLLCSGENSLREKLDDYLKRIESRREVCAEAVVTHRRNADMKLSRFQAYGMGDALRDAFKGRFHVEREWYEAYHEECAKLYDATRAGAYYAALIEALKGFKAYLEEYINTLCNTLTTIRAYGEECREELSCIRVDETLFDVNAILKALEETLSAKGMVRGEFVREAYRMIMNGGMHMKGAPIGEAVRADLDQLRKMVFASVESLTTVQKIQQFENIEPGAPTVNYIRTEICPMLRDGARVMYPVERENRGLGAEAAAEFTIVEIPDDDSIAEAVEQYAGERAMRILLKRVRGGERICWLTDKGGMPLSLCAELKKMKAFYEKDAGGGAGRHLYMVPSEPSGVRSVKHDWYNLPDVQ